MRHDRNARSLAGRPAEAEPVAWQPAGGPDRRPGRPAARHGLRHRQRRPPGERAVHRHRGRRGGVRVRRHPHADRGADRRLRRDPGLHHRALRFRRPAGRDPHGRPDAAAAGRRALRLDHPLHPRPGDRGLHRRHCGHHLRRAVVLFPRHHGARRRPLLRQARRPCAPLRAGAPRNRPARAAGPGGAGGRTAHRRPAARACAAARPARGDVREHRAASGRRGDARQRVR